MDSLDHVGLSDSYSPAVGTSSEWPFDYFHINSVDQQPGGTTLISARNTSALYELNTATGQVVAADRRQALNVKLGRRHRDGLPARRDGAGERDDQRVRQRRRTRRSSRSRARSCWA